MRPDNRWSYFRQSRTGSSEQYQIMEGDTSFGHLDLHFGHSEVFGTLILDGEATEDEIAEIIEAIDEELVLSAEVPREDFLVRVYVGRDAGLYSDDLLLDEFDSDGQEDAEEL
jgi:hypothetical protein